MIGAIASFIVSRFAILFGLALIAIVAIKTNSYIAGVSNQVEELTSSFEAIVEEQRKLYDGILVTQKSIQSKLEPFFAFKEQLKNAEFPNECVGDNVGAAVDFMRSVQE